VKQAKVKCRRCAKCCYPKIPLTISDLERIAKHFKIHPKQAIKRYVSPSNSKTSNLFNLKKKTNKSCIFLTKQSICSIHRARPATCRFYTCDKSQQDIDMSSESDRNQKRLWQHSQSAGFTKKYVKKHGSCWSKQGYQEYKLSVQP